MLVPCERVRERVRERECDGGVIYYKGQSVRNWASAHLPPATRWESTYVCMRVCICVCLTALYRIFVKVRKQVCVCVCK